MGEVNENKWQIERRAIRRKASKLYYPLFFKSNCNLFHGKFFGVATLDPACALNRQIHSKFSTSALSRFYPRIERIVAKYHYTHKMIYE